MTVMIVPAVEEEPWPTLGPQVCAFIEQNLVFGPGDLRGLPARLTDEKRALIYRMYEVEPQFLDAKRTEKNPKAGRRRFRRVAVSLRKGLAKTELAAWIAACELHPEGPVRCDGFDEAGRPVGRGVTDPYIPMVAYTEEQTEDLAYAALLVVLGEGPLADDFDLGLERIVRIKGDGKAVALASSPDARDGARTTWEHFDETHRFTLPRLKAAHRTMLANLPKRRLADAWALETTTAYATGEGSVAEDTMTYARSIAAGEASNPQLFFYHRQASEDRDISTAEGLRAAVLEASGADAAWSDVEGICAQFEDPTSDVQLLRRLWLNQPVAGGGRAFPIERWHELANPAYQAPDGALIVLGFDGSRFGDATALIATEVATGFQWPIGIWAPPARQMATGERWEVSKAAVDAAVTEAFRRWDVWRMYCDPPEFDETIDAWAGRFGEQRVHKWWTRRLLQMGMALQTYRIAMIDGTVTHDGDPVFAQHIGNTVRKDTNIRDDKGNMLWVVQKERGDSPFKIDAAVAGALSWEARNDAIAAGVTGRGPVVEPGYSDRTPTTEMASARTREF